MLQPVKLDERGKLPREFEKMDPTLPLNDAECCGDKFEPKRRQVHVLVVVPIDHAAKRQKVESSALVDTWGQSLLKWLSCRRISS